MRYYYGHLVKGFRTRMQMAEAFGSTNRYFCSRFDGYPVRDRNRLLEYFADNCGCVDFARRFAEAMGEDNRWYCSRYHGRPIDDQKTLWNYYKKHSINKFRNECLELQAA